MAKNEFCFQSDLSPCAMGPSGCHALPGPLGEEGGVRGSVFPLGPGNGGEVGPPLWLPGVQAEDTSTFF